MRYKNIITLLLVTIIMLTSSGFAFSQWTKVVVALKGNIFDAISKQPVGVEILVYDNTGKKVNQTKSSKSEEGYYYITGLIPGNTYSIDFKSDEYLFENLSVSIPNTDKYLEISRDLNMKPKASNTQIPISVPPFEVNKSKLKYGSGKLLDALANTMKNNPEIKFSIKSYPDDEDNPKENLKLTKDRANAIYDFFVTYGIDPARMKIIESDKVDPKSPPPSQKRAKGKRYIGPTYIIINWFHNYK